METLQFESKLVSSMNRNPVLQNLVMILSGSLFLAIAAQITIPLTPIPVTLQSFAILFIGMAFGPRMGGKIILAYLAEGLCGLPVFANFGWGLHVLLSPVGGYLLGFAPAAMLTGYLLQKGWAKNRIMILVSAALGLLVLFAMGYLGLSCFVGLHNAYLLGVAPFYGIAAIKTLILAAITPWFWRAKNH